MKQSPENWRSLPDMQPRPQAVHDWWNEWYKRILESQTTTNAMPFVYNPLRGAGVGSGEDSPATKAFGVFDDPSFIRQQIFPGATGPVPTPQVPQPATPGATSSLSPDVLALLNQIPQDQLLLLLQNFVSQSGGRPGG